MSTSRAVGTIEINVFVVGAAWIFHPGLELCATISPDAAAKVEVFGFEGADAGCEGAGFGFFFAEFEVGGVVDVRRAGAVF